MRQHWLAITHLTLRNALPVITPFENLQTDPDVIVTDPGAWKLFVFRKSRDPLSTTSLLRELRTEIESLTDRADSAIDALVRAGEIETGLADANSPVASRVAQVVDQLAAAACGGSLARAQVLRRLEEAAGAEHLPQQVRCAHPEGFSYYGLHPLDFADLAGRVSRDLNSHVQVIGIRSVGSTLGAVVTAALQTCGKSVDRITVRPEGEPYQRRTAFDSAQLGWIAGGLQRRADFVIVDEGPGFSGSTLLSVARALGQAGVPASSIVLMGSRPFLSRSGRGHDDGWSRFRSYVIDYGKHVPQGAGRSLGDGAWRELLYPSPSQWPPCWIEQERIKHLSQDSQVFFKFEGFGRYGRLSRQHASALADAGFSPPILRFENGFGCYQFVPGKPLIHQDVSGALLSRIAAYCAFRVKHFPAANPNVDRLQDMMQVNLGVEFGFPDVSFSLPVEKPVYPDCSMSPHEWLLAADGETLKADAVGHAEGHQLPGPTDIVWDLAGTILEWKLSSAEAEFFLEEYQRFSGDHAVVRIRQYLLAYAIFRMARCRMAAAATGRRREARYLRLLYKEYSQQVKEMLEGVHLGKMASQFCSFPPAIAQECSRREIYQIFTTRPRPINSNSSE